MSSTTAPTAPPSASASAPTSASASAAASAAAADAGVGPARPAGVPWPESPDGGCGVPPPAVPLPDVAPDVGASGHGPVQGRVLGRLGDILDARDRLAGQLLSVLTAARRDGRFGGLSAQVWLEQAGRMGSGDARRLLAHATVLAALPAVTGALADGRLSYSQTIQIAAAAATVPASRRDDLDTLIGRCVDQYRGYGPDELTDRVWAVVDRWQPDRLTKAHNAAAADEFLALQPELLGGGSIYGRFGPTHFATLAEAVDTPLGPPVATDLDDPDATEAALDELDVRRRALARTHGKHAAARLIDLCEHALAGHHCTHHHDSPPTASDPRDATDRPDGTDTASAPSGSPDATDNASSGSPTGAPSAGPGDPGGSGGSGGSGGAGGAGGAGEPAANHDRPGGDPHAPSGHAPSDAGGCHRCGCTGTSVPARPLVHAVIHADTLCDPHATPGWLLTTLTGGTMKATSGLIRRLIDQRGVDLTGIVLDDHGQIIGVGRTRRHPPGWLRDAIHTRDLTDRAPNSHTAVRRTDLDHIVAWTDGGPTNVDNLHAIGRHAHTDKTARTWQVTRTRNGTTTWTHTPTGLTVRRPSTWTRLDQPPDNLHPPPLAGLDLTRHPPEIGPVPDG